MQQHFKWEPEKVITYVNGMTLIDPDIHPASSEKASLRLIFIRNLSRRVIEKCCSTEWQPEN